MFGSRLSTHNVKQMVIHHYREMVNSAVGLKVPSKPKEGWIRTVRKALDMSGAQLATRLGLSRNQISILERKEVEGNIKLSQLEDLARQLDCDFVYAFVPRRPVEQIIENRALKMATEKMTTNSQNMFLEAQSIDSSAKERLLESVKKELVAAGGRVLWRE